jgi:ABC-type uncharacterized transport system substrate-binding protein
MIQRREFIAGLGSAAAAWPLAARAQQPALPVIGYLSDQSADDDYKNFTVPFLRGLQETGYVVGRNVEIEHRWAENQYDRLPVVGFVDAGSADATAGYMAAFRKGLDETGYVEGQNVTVEQHYLEGQYDRLPALMADLVRRRVAVIAATGGATAAVVAKAATATIPIVFGVGDDPVKLGLVASLARPGGNATGSNFFNAELPAKRLGLLHELVPKAVRVGVLVNPADATNTEATLRDMQQAARAIGLQIQILNASTSSGSCMACAPPFRRPARWPRLSSQRYVSASSRSEHA